MLEQVVSYLQRRLFPSLEEELGTLSATDQRFCAVLALLKPDGLLRRYEWVGRGCPPHSRSALLRAFLAKGIYQLPTTNRLIEELRSHASLRRVCGWESAGDVPSASTFSRFERLTISSLRLCRRSLTPALLPQASRKG